MTAASTILRFDRVTVEAEGDYDSGIWEVSLRLRAGELALVRLEATQPRLPLADAAAGVVEPAAGRVCFLGEDWRAASAQGAGALRGRIGRVFDEGGWCRELDVDGNIVLAQAHHTRRPVPEIEAEAAELARRFRLPGLPRGRPAQVRRQDLHRCAWVRALLGQPVLLLLDTPTVPLDEEIRPVVLNALAAARARGAAILWTTGHDALWGDRALRPTFRYAMAGAQMLEAAKEP